ncbi:hypothetical protein [Dyella terrae]|uniref:hypothetical protein n=1 Tax=Dyella terrae TaxID=522259 RepID=UPI001EFEAD9D|nr:hypothetical protein [Dyella terrae]ULU27036.1 hypothetical protein DYST_03988 [Dyella terrae]
MKTLRGILMAGLTLTGMAWMSASVATELPDKTAEGWYWKLQSAGKANSSNDFEVAARRGEQLLVWDDGKQAQYADYVILLVPASFEQVQPVVQAALAPLGTFRSDSAGSVENLSASWKKLWMSRHPELKASASDVLGQITYASWSAHQVRKSGFANRHTSELYVGVADRTMVFDHPATIVVLSQRDVRPDPEYSFFKEWRSDIGGAWHGLGSSRRWNDLCRRCSGSGIYGTAECLDCASGRPGDRSHAQRLAAGRRPLPDATAAGWDHSSRIRMTCCCAWIA